LVCRVSDLLLGGLLCLLGQKDGLDVRQHTALSDGYSTEEFVELLVIADSQLQMAGDDAGLLVVAGSIAGQLEDLSGQILKHGRQVDRSPGSDAMSIVALAKKSVHTANGELEPGTG
jgi:hypothetical protein